MQATVEREVLDPEQGRELIEKGVPEIRRFIRSRLGAFGFPIQEVEDICQDVLLRLHRNPPRRVFAPTTLAAFALKGILCDRRKRAKIPIDGMSEWEPSVEPDRVVETEVFWAKVEEVLKDHPMEYHFIRRCQEVEHLKQLAAEIGVEPQRITILRSRAFRLLRESGLFDSFL